MFGHTVRLMAPKFVAPYRKSGKNDGNDAEAICEAVSRPSMRFVPVKSVEQQAMLTLHRVRLGFVEERTATINRIRGCWRSSVWCCRSVLLRFAAVRPRCSNTCRFWPHAHSPIYSRMRECSMNTLTITNGSSSNTRAMMNGRSASST